MSRMLVSIKDLSHRYSVKWAVRNISFDINSKGVVGLLGSNGAGKSTTMNILCGVLNQTKGDVFIDGINLRENPVEAKKNIGFLPQQPPLYPDLTVGEYLKYASKFRLIDKNDINKFVDIALEKCSIQHFKNRLIKNLSGGYQQRVGIAQAIVHNPKLVVLDEPTNGLDPNQIVDIRNLIRNIASEHTVLLSTHILSEVQAMCNDIKMIENGHLVFSGKMEDFDNYIRPESFILELKTKQEKKLIESISENREVEMLDEYTFRIYFDDDMDITDNYIKKSVEEDWGLRRLYIERKSLEDIFSHLSANIKGIE